MDNVNTYFAANLKSRRRALGLTQKQLADRIAYSEKAVSKWETGSAIAPSILLPMLARVLAVSIDDLFCNPADPIYFLGIDGGGTKTEFALADKSGQIVKKTVLTGCNPVDVGIEQTFTILHQGIYAVCGDIDPQKISAFAGIAGGITGDNKQQIAHFLDGFHFAAAGNGSDAENAVAACLHKEDGIVVICGTGNITFVQKDGIMNRFGGFGYLFDDGGSGYSLGQAAILAALKDEESTGDKTCLTSLICKKLNVSSVLSCLSHFYKGGKRTIASYAPLVFEAHQQGDRIATDILDRTCQVIASYIKRSARLFESASKIKVVISGGLAKQEQILLPIVLKHLEHNPCYELSVYTTQQVNGALLLAGMPEEER